MEPDERESMAAEIRTIRLGSSLIKVNCYLVKTNAGYVLIDTGSSGHRADLEKELERAGCRPGDLRLIVLTHADSDHAGNAAFLRNKYGAKIALHRGESQVVETGDMIWSRKNRPLLTRILLPLFRLGPSDRFKPDLYVEEGDNLSAYGFDAQILHLSGHSNGSIGIVTAGGSGLVLFCGDLFTNTGKPVLNSLMDDLAAAKASVERLESLPIDTVYPGHGQPFKMESLVHNPS